MALRTLPLLGRLLPPSPSPVDWAGLGVTSRWIGRWVPPLAPPLLILSLPRSGSSWAGEILGHADNALYLREPLTQHALQFDGAHGALRFQTATNVAQQEALRAQQAFLGIPDFISGVVREPAQWALARRRRRRVVIKEVNPFAAHWLLESFRPRCLVLIRHPAAVADSFRRLDWSGRQDMAEARRFLEAAGIQPPTVNEQDFWSVQGLVQGAALTALARLEGTGERVRLVQYEELCADPEARFRELAEWAGLEWTPALDQRLRSTSQATAGRDDAYDTHRDTRAMPLVWRSRVSVDEARRLRRTLAEFNLPWYAADSDWEEGN